MPKHIQHTTQIGVPLTGTPINSAIKTGFEPSKAFDGDPNTYFESAATSNAFIGLDLGSPKIVKVVRVKSKTSTYVIQASNDNLNYIEIGSIGSLVVSSDWLEVTLPNTTAYRYYRLFQLSFSCPVSEIQFYENASDVTGSLPSLTVEKIKGKYLDTSNISNNTAVTYVSSTNTLQFKAIGSSTQSNNLLISESTVAHQTSGSTPSEVLNIIAPTLGTYLVEFTTSSEISRRGSSGFYAIYTNNGMITESDRTIDSSSTNSSNFMLRWSVYTMAIVTTTTANEVISVRARSSANNNTVTTYERVMTVLKLN